MPEKIIIDTDPGIDDAMAIFFAMASPELELLGLTTTFGNVSVEMATDNALRLVEMSGLYILIMIIIDYNSIASMCQRKTNDIS